MCLQIGESIFVLCSYQSGYNLTSQLLWYKFFYCWHRLDCFFLMRQETSLDSQEQVEINCSFLFFYFYLAVLLNFKGLCCRGRRSWRRSGSLSSEILSLRQFISKVLNAPWIDTDGRFCAQVLLATYFHWDKLTIRNPKFLTQIQVEISKLYYFRKREVNKD